MAEKCFFAFGPSITKSQTNVSEVRQMIILIKLIKHIAGLFSGIMPLRGLDKQFWKSTNPPCLLISLRFNKPPHVILICQVTDLKGIWASILGTPSTGCILFLTLCTMHFDGKRVKYVHSAHLSLYPRSL